jgi:hypothetical protein
MEQESIEELTENIYKNRQTSTKWNFKSEAVIKFLKIFKIYEVKQIE